MAHTKHPADIAFICTFCTDELAEHHKKKYEVKRRRHPMLLPTKPPVMGFPTSGDLHRHNDAVHCDLSTRAVGKLTHVDHRVILSQELTGHTLTTYFNASEFHKAGVLVNMPATEEDMLTGNTVTRQGLQFSNRGKYYAAFPGTNFK